MNAATADIAIQSCFRAGSDASFSEQENAKTGRCSWNVDGWGVAELAVGAGEKGGLRGAGVPHPGLGQAQALCLQAELPPAFLRPRRWHRKTKEALGQAGAGVSELPPAPE